MSTPTAWGAGSDATEPDPELLAAVTELGAAVRELLETSVATTVPAGEQAAVAAGVRELTARLAASTRDRHTLSALDDLPTFRRTYSPVTGTGHGFAPPVRFRREGGVVVGEATLGLRHEGPPAHCHGGVSALLMDQLLGSAAFLAGRWGMTAHLGLEYRGAVPLQTPVVLTAQVTEASGRKTVVAGTIALAAEPDRHLVRGEAVFVSPRAELLERYFGELTTADGAPAPGHGHAATDGTAP
ncbi:Thioesterase superfamily protein [Klenkia marina]|uniref:Thioesterase superfamily protein n=1 Tax=Klenkia marina TaxID=1960309 RepID=A0A1G4XY77_9ACTN|nr:PaaI family thioesterase [Klenkia marina]SCX46083.1 Thioesterase superfamily protein [Klenkia marina]